MKWRIAARSSPLSRAQVAEWIDLAIRHLPTLACEVLWVETRGDLDRTTSLRSIENSSFFTDTIDHMVIAKEVDLGIHSAKDLPLPLMPPLVLAAVTQSLDPRDSLVLRPNETLCHGSCIATSSVRREAIVRDLFPSLALRFRDLRGTIHERLHLLETHDADGVVVAEAALIRLQLNPPRLYLPGLTAPLQGCLAAVTHSDQLSIIQSLAWAKPSI